MNKSKKVALLSAFAAVAVIFSYAEAMLPANILPIGGFKIGFSNIAVLTVLYLFGSREAVAVMLVRTAVSTLLFSGVLSLVLSLAGGLLSITTMILLRKCGKFSVTGVSVAGATMHNIGQLSAAALILRDLSVTAYLPWLMVLSLVCGALIGAATVFILKVLFKAKEI